MTVNEIINDAKEKIRQATGANDVDLRLNVTYKDGILPNTPLGELKKIIVDVTGVRWELLLSKIRIREVVEARQLFCYFATDFFGVGLMKIARILKRDHTTVMFGRDRIRDLVDVKDKEIFPKVNLIKSRLHEIHT